MEDFEFDKPTKKEINRKIKKNNPYKKRDKFNPLKGIRYLKRRQKEEVEIEDLESEISKFNYLKIR